MDHPFEFRAHYNDKGKPCHCPWGYSEDGEHLGAVKEASKLKWLEDRPDMQSPRNQFWLRYMQEQGLADEKTDKLLPWLHREFKKGRLLPAGNDTGYFPGAGPSQLHYTKQGEPWQAEQATGPSNAFNLEGKPSLATDHYSHGALDYDSLANMQRDLEEMQKRGKGVDLMQHKVHELIPKVKDFQDWRKAQNRKDMGEVLHRFDDGWTMRRLQNAAEHDDEGDLMGHCIGGENYTNDTKNGRQIYASLRDPKNLPHASIQLTPDHWRNSSGETSYDNDMGGPQEGWIPQVGPASQAGEFYGKEDSYPNEEYEDRVNDWLQSHGASEAQGGRGEMGAQEWDIPAPDSVEDYNYHYGEDFDPYQYAPEDYNPEAENDWRFDEPDYMSMARNYLGMKRYHAEESPSLPSSEARRELFDNLREHGGHNLFERDLYGSAQPDNPTHQQLLDEWEQWKAPYYHPLTGEYTPYGNPMEEFQPRLVEERTFPQRQPRELIPRWKHLPAGRPEDLGPQYGPEQSAWTYNSSVHNKPLYYRWVFSPSKGVTLGTNQDDHPALINYHQGLGGEINDTDLTHGYAYPIGNGWRLTNYEHQPVGDPYIVNQVVRRLNHENEPEMRSEGSWQPSEYNWERIHYALPHEKIVPLN